MFENSDEASGPQSLESGPSGDRYPRRECKECFAPIALAANCAIRDAVTRL